MFFLSKDTVFLTVVGILHGRCFSKKSWRVELQKKLKVGEVEKVESAVESSSSDEGNAEGVKILTPQVGTSEVQQKVITGGSLDPTLFTKMLYLRREYAVLLENRVAEEYLFDSSVAPLSTGGDYTQLARYFVKLYDSWAYHPYIFTQYWKSTTTTNLKRGIDVKRSRTHFITRFMSHGQKERFLKAHGRVISYLFLSYRNQFYPIDFILSKNLYQVLYFYGYINIFISAADADKPAEQRLHPRLRMRKFNKIYKQLFWAANPLIFPENTELAQKNMSDFAPAYTYFTTRMDKRIYKATRGKLGHYVVQGKKLHHSRALPYMYSQLKLQYLASNKATYVDRLIGVLQCAYFIPEQTLGFIAGEAAEWEADW